MPLLQHDAGNINMMCKYALINVACKCGMPLLQMCLKKWSDFAQLPCMRHLQVGFSSNGIVHPMATPAHAVAQKDATIV